MRARRYVRGAAIAALILGGSSAIGFWIWKQRRLDTTLAPGWPAQALVLAGDGVIGTRDGHTAHARFSDPFGVASAPDGSIYVADGGETGRIRRIGPDGTVSTIAGGTPGYADGRGAAARFNAPSGVAVDRNGVIYIADTGNNMIRRITPDGVVSTLAGHLLAGFGDGREHAARFNGPIGVAVATSSRVIVADSYNDRIRAIEQDGRVVTIAGSGTRGAVDGPAMDAQFDTPCGVAVDESGNIFVADTGNNAIRMISAAGVVTTIGPPPPLGLLRPIGIAVSHDGIVYVGDQRGRVVEITPGIDARTVAGSRPGFANGSGEDARFRALAGLALVAPGRLIVVDSRNALIRLVVARDRLELRLPSSPLIEPAFDVEAFARDPLLWPLSPMDGPFEITGTLGEARGGEGSERFHAGVDVHAAEDTPVVAVRSAAVTSPTAAEDFGTLNESVRLGPITYVHLRVGRSREGTLADGRFVPTYDESGRVVGMRVRRGARFATGEVIGTSNSFNHVHLNVGWPGEEYNPLQFRLVNFEDAVPPTIARNGVRLFSAHGEPIAGRSKGRFVVDGEVQVVVDAWDQVNGNERRRRLGLYELGYQVLHADGSPVAGFETPRVTIRFDRLAPAEDAPRAVYASGSGIPFFGRRSTRFLYAITSTLRNGVASVGVWNTTTLPPGDYLLRVVASDIEGNQAIRNRDVPVTIPERPNSAPAIEVQ